MLAGCDRSFAHNQQGRGCLEDLCRLSDSLTSLIHMYEYMILTDYFIEKHWLIFYSEAVAHLKACMQQQV